MAVKASLKFAPGLLEMLQSGTPPTPEFFGMLPVEADSSLNGACPARATVTAAAQQQERFGDKNPHC